MKSLKTLPPFVKGDRGGFRRAKRLLHGIESSEMVSQQTPHITYLSTYGVSPRLPLPWLGSIQTKNADFITLRNTIVYRSRYQIAPVTVFTGFKATRLSTVSDSCNESRSEKRFPCKWAPNHPSKALYVILSPPKAGE